MMLIVLTTTPTAEEAESLAEKLVAERLAACVQILPQMTSIYVWNSAVQREPEHLLLIKTFSEKWDEVRDFITANHSYTVPEIVAVEAESVSGPYLEWMKQVLNSRS
jgi:periplasmic divalent cation tolerance protein